MNLAAVSLLIGCAVFFQADCVGQTVRPDANHRLRPTMAEFVRTRTEARRRVFSYCNGECVWRAQHGEKPSLPYRATFRRALTGDYGALHTVFTDERYHSGDNESWIDVEWDILHAVGDRPFTAFLARLSTERRATVLLYLCYAVYGPSTEELRSYLHTHFPGVSRVYSAYQSRPGA